MRYKLAIFDWDGTIMDSIARIVAAMQCAAQEFSLPSPETKAIKSIIGLSLPLAVERLFPQHPELHHALVDAYKRQYKLEHQPSTPLFEGVSEVLETLKARGYVLAVATGKGRPGLDRLLAETGLSSFFTVTKSSDDALSKPSPDMLAQILAATQVKADNAVMIGDTTIDLQMAQGINMPAIGVTFGVCTAAELTPFNPVAVVDSFTELLSVLT